MTTQSFAAQLVVSLLLGITCALGLPLFHYVTALMITVILRHGRGDRGLLTPVSLRAPAGLGAARPG